MWALWTVLTILFEEKSATSMVPETIFVDDLLKELRNTQRQMAILLDEYGGMAGLVTLGRPLRGNRWRNLMTKQIRLKSKFIKLEKILILFKVP